MPLISNVYGKGRVRVLRLFKDGERQEVRELTVQPMLTGDFSAAFTDADNSKVVSTDTVKNVVNIVARESLNLGNEEFALAVARRFLDRYPQVETATVTAHETKWRRHEVGGKPHLHSFTLDGNGRPFVEARMARDGSSSVTSGVSDYMFMKSTESGWSGYTKDPYTTIRETDDRICATSMEARWTWRKAPASYEAANARILETMLEVFATTYSASVQDSLYRMGEAALAAVPELEQVSAACPNKHYLLVNLAPFGLDNPNAVFTPTDEPHGQIECVVGR
ncbi:factor-independent urate hydroxylase [Neomegalonema sp.]|uniref:factor-independent urate hydroxylase n=1 Tax=Neomegalonema sp. TaxID=2039713 RepID=UPI002629A7B4|nr:urate oxidase [Neomegalonema sp.]MDD2869277.1 urate oxidase [Neomegalonema sp.]